MMGSLLEEKTFAAISPQMHVLMPHLEQLAPYGTYLRLPSVPS